MKWSKYIKPYLAYYILGPLCMIVEVIGEVLMPKFLSLIIDYGLGSKSMEEAPKIIRYLYSVAGGTSPYIIAITVAMILTAIFMMLGGVGGAYFGARASVNFAADLRRDIYSRVQGFSFANIDKFSTGGIITRITTDVNNVRMAFQMITRIAVRAPLMLLFSLLMILKNKKIHPFMIIQTILVIASLIFILTCPGNSVRTETEIQNTFKDFEMLTVLDKIGVGITSTMGQIIGKSNIIFAIMSLIIAVYVYSNYKESLYRIVAIIPVFSIWGLCYFSSIFKAIFPYFGALKDLIIKEEVMLTAANCNNLLNVIPIIFAGVNFICIIMSLLLIFKNLKDNVALLVFLVGLASRLIMGFSPTVFLSGERTMLFLDFSMIIVGLLVWQELIKKSDKNDKKIQKRMEFVIKSGAILQYINCLVCILITQK